MIIYIGWSLPVAAVTRELKQRYGLPVLRDIKLLRVRYNNILYYIHTYLSAGVIRPRLHARVYTKSTARLWRRGERTRIRAHSSIIISCLLLTKQRRTYRQFVIINRLRILLIVVEVDKFE